MSKLSEKATVNDGMVVMLGKTFTLGVSKPAIEI
jgi:hypothetical protein